MAKRIAMKQVFFGAARASTRNQPAPGTCDWNVPGNGSVADFNTALLGDITVCPPSSATLLMLR